MLRCCPWCCGCCRLCSFVLLLFLFFMIKHATARSDSPEQSREGRNWEGLVESLPEDTSFSVGVTLVAEHRAWKMNFSTECVFSRARTTLVSRYRHRTRSPPNASLTQAHDRNMSVGLRNDREQLEQLEPSFDWALSEDCLIEGLCEVR